MHRFDYIELDVDKILKETQDQVKDISEREQTIRMDVLTAEKMPVESLKEPREEMKEGPGEETKDKNAKPKSRWKKHFIRLAAVLCVLVVSYLTIVYSDIPFIAKWRTIYIETAMTTNSHQWLATFFFPKSVIDEVMARKKKDTKDQKKLSSKWDVEEADEEAEDFYHRYWELDCHSFHEYIEEHPELVKDGYESLVIDNLNGRENLKTVKGDALLVLDTENHLMILGIKGDGYQGKLAIVKEPSQIDLVKSTALGAYGQEAGSFGAANGAILVVNASGFEDVDGIGTGGEVKGSLVIDGVDYGHPNRDFWKFCGMKKDNRLYISNYSAGIVKDYRWAVEFFPALIVDGVSVVDGTYGMGIQPRTAIGQTVNEDFLLLVVDGRQPGYSLGCTVADCEAILKRYQAYQAMNMDGGSSSVMWYNGEYITKSSSVTGIGRYMPDAVIVKPSQDEMVIKAKPES